LFEHGQPFLLYKMTVLTYCAAKQESERSAVLSQHDRSWYELIGNLSAAEQATFTHPSSPAVALS